MKHFVLLALRQAGKGPIFAMLNLAGLAIGLAVCWLVALFVSGELGYDRFLKNSTRICQVTLSGNMTDQAFETSNTPPTVGPALAAEFPEVEAFVRLYYPGDAVLQRPGAGPEAIFTETGGRAVDSNFLDVFNFALLDGDRHACLRDPNAVVLTEKLARRYFGRSNAVGEVLQIDGTPCRVTAVLARIPTQSTLQFDFLRPIAAYPTVQRFSWSWVWLQVDTYVLLAEGAATPERRAALEAKFPAMVARYAESAFRRIGQPYDEFLKKGGYWNFGLQPLHRVHLYSGGLAGRISTLGDVREVYIFSGVGLFVLALACVNFMNLATARSARRLREVGIRKALGSQRPALVRQFLAESLLYSAVAAVLAAALVLLALPAVNRLTGTELTFSGLLAGWTAAVTLALPLLAGLLGGSYPALFLSGFKPAGLLKGSTTATQPAHGRLRSGLVVFQFSVAIALLACALIVFRQLHFARRGEMGFNRENVLLIKQLHRIGRAQETFRDELLSTPGVVTAGLSTDRPGGGSFGDFYVPQPEAANLPVAKDVTLSSYLVDEYFVPTLDLRIKAGRAFSSDFQSDSAAIILNETAVKAIGWQNPVGQYLTYPGNGNQRFQVIGVVEDFHVESLRTAVQPFALFHRASKTYDIGQVYLAVRIQPGSEQRVVSQAAALWQGLAPEAPFDYSFLDADFNALYRSEQKVGTVLASLAALAVVIACLGLIGLIAFAAERRTREIAVRRVLGATVGSITALLARDFVRLVALAVVLATPIAWWFMQRWLADFAYRVDIEWWVFAVAGAAALIIVLAAAGLQGLKAATVNPVKNLRNE